MKKKLKTTNAHKLYNHMLYDRDMLPVVAYGSAGTGKTYGAVKAAYERMTSNREFQQIIVTRPNVSFAEKSGFLPGTEREKMDPWVRPIIQGLIKSGVAPSEVEYLEKSQKLVFYPLEFIQGMTFDNAFIIVDECQNMTFDQLKVFLGRTGDFSKVVLCGDVEQVSPKFQGSGLAELIDMVEHFDMRCHTLNFTRDDIVRSEDCKAWICAFEDWAEAKKKLKKGVQGDAKLTKL